MLVRLACVLGLRLGGRSGGNRVRFRVRVGFRAKKNEKGGDEKGGDEKLPEII